ncbi:TraR/DksA C4-type zinc finger protein [uncultured Arsenicicoccus sp.]|uniref:TraR/DksA family transcriptional regulator n=1 Tax=uncultured Arsenicicoccus sp. TaxID=491339 RepID=UPI0025983D4C|nr:TraR/DksA C4-type zinc finger protein [uncultured Arsenicicoccus sp.]
MVPPEVRAALDALRRQTLERVQDLERDRSRIVDASRSSNADDEHDPEGQTIAWDREQTAALLRDARARLAETDVASARLDGGWDGSCEVCGGPIPPGRLLARPTTARCVGCA